MIEPMILVSFKTFAGVWTEPFSFASVKDCNDAMLEAFPAEDLRSAFCQAKIVYKFDLENGSGHSIDQDISDSLAFLKPDIESEVYYDPKENVAEEGEQKVP